MITSRVLQKLGFKSDIDFILQDDGNGVYIAEWNSNLPKPEVTDIESAYTEWETEFAAEQEAKKNRLASAKNKLEALGLTTEEVKEAFGI